MPFAVNFRWKTPNVQAVQPASVRDGWDKSISQAAQGIASMKQSRFNKKEAERRNRIEDEDRKRRMDFEDKQRQAWKESADLMRGAARERDALVKEKAELEARIAQLQG